MSRAHKVATAAAVLAQYGYINKDRALQIVCDETHLAEARTEQLVKAATVVAGGEGRGVNTTNIKEEKPQLFKAAADTNLKEEKPKPTWMPGAKFTDTGLYIDANLKAWWVDVSLQTVTEAR